MLTVGSSAMVTAAHQYFAFWLLHICGAFFVGLPVKPAMTKGKTMTGRIQRRENWQRCHPRPDGI